MVYYELGRFPLIYLRMYKIVKYCLKYYLQTIVFLNTVIWNNYRHFVKIRTVGFTQLKQLLLRLGLNDMWYNQDNLIVDNNLLLFVKGRMYDQVKQSLNEQLNSSSQCYLYKYIVNNICLHNYLTKHLNFSVFNSLEIVIT